MAANGISTLETKELRQIAKLDLAAAKRGESYDIDLLPTKYDGNNLVNNPNVGGLQPHRPWTAGSPPPSGNDFGFTGDQNMWIINGGFNAGSTFSDPAPTNPAYTYPDNSYTGKTYNFDGTSYMIGANLSIGGSWQSNTITIDFWFYPTANGIQLLTELGQPQLNAYYHTTLLEISSTGNIKARFWQIGGGLAQVITSTNTVDLNAWNHIYFTEDSIGGHSFKLNNVATTGLPSYTRATPLINSNNSIHYAVGGSDATNMGNTGGFQGKIGYLNIHDYIVASTWTATNARFRPAQILVMDLDPMNYTSGSSISDASGQNNNGTLVGGPVLTTGGTNGSGNYFTLDGTSQYITVPSLLNSAYGSVTMSLWFNSSTGVGSLITKELSYKMRLNAGGSLAVLGTTTGSAPWVYNSTNILDIVSNDAWHHVAVSISPTFVDWYLDGTSIQHEAGIGNLGTNTQPLMIGSYGLGTSEFFTGKIGPARLYNYALTSQEVTDYYNATKARFRPTTYSLATAGAVTSIDEGAALTFNVTTTNVADGTILTWITDRNPTDAGGYPIAANRFSPADSGSVTINNNTGTFTVTISADSFTAPLPQLYNIVVAGSNTVGITVNDTSQTPPPSFNQVISLNPNYIVTNGGTSIPNDADEGSTSATVVGAFTSSPAQGGSITLIDFQTSAVYLPAKNIKTIGMWIKIINQQAAVQYLLDSRERVGPNFGLGTGYFYSSGYEGWSLMSINGNPADNSLWSTVANNTNVWQYVTLINQTNTPHSITLFNRYSLAEGLATIQVGWIEAWDYIQVDSQIAAAYASHSSNYV